MNTAEFARRAAAEGLIDVAYAGVDSPFGHLTRTVGGVVVLPSPTRTRGSFAEA